VESFYWSEHYDSGGGISCLNCKRSFTREEWDHVEQSGNGGVEYARAWTRRKEIDDLVAELHKAAKGAVKAHRMFVDGRFGPDYMSPSLEQVRETRAARMIERLDAEAKQLREDLRVPGTGWTRPDGEEFFGAAAIREQAAYYERRLDELWKIS
jgi:hypothetical protein